RSQSRLESSGPCCVIAAEARTADGDTVRIDITACQQIIDARAHRHFIIEAVPDAMLAQSGPLARPIHQQARNTALERTAANHEVELLLERIQPAESDQDSLPAAGAAT